MSALAITAKAHYDLHQDRHSFADVWMITRAMFSLRFTLTLALISAMSPMAERDPFLSALAHFGEAGRRLRAFWMLNVSDGFFS